MPFSYRDIYNKLTLVQKKIFVNHNFIRFVMFEFFGHCAKEK